MMIEPRAAREIHDIRLAIYEDIKDMTPEERTAYFADAAREAIDKYGIKVGTPADIRKHKAM